MKIKIFTHHDSRALETQVNKWLSENYSLKFRLHSVTQSESGGNDDWSLTVTIVYEA
jgi:hypothetical protein